MENIDFEQFKIEYIEFRNHLNYTAGKSKEHQTVLIRKVIKEKDSDPGLQQLPGTTQGILSYCSKKT